MPSVFARIIAGELSARFVWQDPVCVAFLSTSPLKPGHTLVVPREEVDDWLDLDDAARAHLFTVARKLGLAIRRAFKPQKVGVMIAGLEVRHVHIHLVPIDAVGDLDFARQERSPAPVGLDAAAEAIRRALV